MSNDLQNISPNDPKSLWSPEHLAISNERCFGCGARTGNNHRAWCPVLIVAKEKAFEMPLETRVFNLVKASLLGTHFSPEHAADLKRLIDSSTQGCR